MILNTTERSVTPPDRRPFPRVNIGIWRQNVGLFRPDNSKIDFLGVGIFFATTPQIQPKPEQPCEQKTRSSKHQTRQRGPSNRTGKQQPGTPYFAPNPSKHRLLSPSHKLNRGRRLRKAADMPNSAHIQRDAELIYNYHHMRMPMHAADAIFCLCSLDTRVAARAAQLYLDGLAPVLIFSGNSGALTEGRFRKTEAETFADIARGMGVPDDKMIVERRATNTGENVRFTHALLQGMHLHPRSLVLVQKPYMERRTYATFKKQWPGKARFCVTSPPLSFGEYPDEDNPRDLVISIMVGDLVRIREYPALGFQVEQDIPDGVWAAMERLVRAGYDKHLPEGFVVDGSK